MMTPPTKKINSAEHLLLLSIKTNYVETKSA